MATDPSRFDVIVTDNLFGDIITDLAAAITGGIAWRPAATSILIAAFRACSNRCTVRPRHRRQQKADPRRRFCPWRCSWSTSAMTRRPQGRAVSGGGPPGSGREGASSPLDAEIVTPSRPGGRLDRRSPDCWPAVSSTGGRSLARRRSVVSSTGGRSVCPLRVDADTFSPLT